MNRDKYLKIIKKLKLNEPEEITEEQSNEIVNEYLSWLPSIKRVNQLYLDDKNES